MHKRQVNRLANKLMAAAALFTQAVFLLAPMSTVFAQTGSATSSYFDYIAPSTPTNLAATALAYNYVTLNWLASTDNIAVDHYNVSRMTSGIWDIVGYPANNTYTDSTVTAGSSYYYKIEAVDAAGNKSGSSNGIFLNVPSVAAPNPPTSLQAVQSGSSISVTWISSSGATYYAVQRSINGANYIALTTNTTVNYYTDSNVMAGYNYTYRVFACSSSCSPLASISNTILIPASETSPTSTTVLAPSNLTAQANGSTVTLNWIDNSNNESGFKIYRYQNGLWTDIGNVGSNVTTKTEQSVPAGVYKYKIQAFSNDSSYLVYSDASNETPLINITQDDTTYASTSTPPTDATSTAPNYWIDFHQAPSYLATSSKIFARTNILADRVDFTIQYYGSFAGILDAALSTDGFYYYSFRWDLNNFANNTYQLKVFGTKGTANFNSDYISIQLIKPVTTINLDKMPSSTTPNTVSTSTIIKQPSTINFSQPADGATLSSWAKLIVQSYGPIRRVEIFKIINNISSSLGNANLNSTGYQWEFGWDTNTVADGDYSIQAFAWDEQNYKIASKIITVKTVNRIINKTTESQPSIVKPIGPNLIPTTAINEPLNSDPIVAQEIIKPTTIQPAPLPGEEKPLPASTQIIEEILQTAAPQVDARCQDAGINDQLKCTNFLTADETAGQKQIVPGKALPIECRNANIKNTNECEMLMRTEYVAFECKQAGITTKAECREFMQTRFGKPAACSGLSDLACQKLISQIILADFIDQETINRANEELNKVNGKYLELIQAQTTGGEAKATIKEDTATLAKINSALDRQDIKNIEKILPFAKSVNRLNLLILPSTADVEKSKILVNASVLLDSDADGLTDDIEARLGTDKMNADSDGDGYSDGVEVRSNHDPLGTGELKAKLKPMELAIVNKAKLEQPKLSGETRADILKIQRITNSQLAGSSATTTAANELKLQGFALPNDVVSLYIYSVMPIVVTVATDENGNWTYNLDKSLVNGKHEAYVVINDEAGKVKAKSSPFSFFIKEAKAVSQDDFLGGDFAVLDKTTELTGWYVAGSLFLMVVVLGGYLLYQKSKEKNILYSK